MKKRFICLCLWVALIMVCVAGPVHGQEGDFITKDYSVNMVVHEDFSFDITEDISVHFNEARRGIFRSIPLKGQYHIQKEDGTIKSIPFVGRISKIKTNVNKKILTEDGICTIRLGDKNTTITGDMDYNIQYRWQSSDDINREMDWLYFNIIPHFWKAPIEGGQLTIQMPKAFDTSKIQFLAGRYGDFDTDRVAFHVEGNTIHAEIVQPLKANEGITVYIPLPEGYYSQMPSIRRQDPVLIIGAVLTGILSLVLWFTRKHNAKPVQPIAYNPPDNLNPGIIGGIYNGQVDKKKLVAANIIHLANKGYLALEEGETTGLIKKKNTMDLVFLKNISPDEDPLASTIYNGLSLGRRKYLKSGKTTSDNLYYANTGRLSDNLYKNIGAAGEIITNFLEEHIFKYENYYVFFVAILMLLNSVALALFIAYQQYYSSFIGIASITLWIALFSVPILVMGIRRKNKIGSLIKYLLGSWIIFAIFRASYQHLLHLPFYFYLPFIVNILLGVTIAMYPKRSEEGNRLYGEVLGFKHFIETAEKDRLEMLVEENPQYFYAILPYAYILNVTNKWAKRFESIQIEPPRWDVERHPGGISPNSFYAAAYVAGRFDTHTFMKQFENNMHRVASEIRTAAPSSGGGFSGGGSGGGGGGFSGGGSGGGGGGSW